MAETEGIPSLGGYDEKFVNAVEEDWQCAICQLPLKDPMLTKCGHRFCRQCLDEHFRRLEIDRKQSCCPVDRNNLIQAQDIFPDKATERNILSLIIRCPNENCDWTGELRSKENHLTSCIFKDVSCTNENCEVKVPRKDLTEHVTTTCQWRIVKCVYCGERHPQCQMENHLETCEGFQIACPNKCGTRIASEMIPHHVENSCPRTKIPCPYLWIGCNSEIRREELESHLQCETRHHLELACCKLNNIQDEAKERTRKLNSLEEKVTSIQRQHQKKVSNLENQLEELKRVNIQSGEINERLNQNNNKIKKELNTYRWGLFFCFAVVFVVVGVLLGIANRVKVVQSHCETKMENMEKSFEGQLDIVQSELELKMEEAQKKFDEKLNGIRSHLLPLFLTKPLTENWF